MLKLQALDAADLEGIVGFAASDDWVEGFKRRHSLSMRARGSQGQKHPEDIATVALGFGKAVIEKAVELGITEIWNADETAVFFELLPRWTLDDTGTKTVWVRCAGAEKRRVSVLLLGSSKGRKKPPFMVLKEQPSRSPEMHKKNVETRHGFGAHIWEDISRIDSGTIFANKAGSLTGSLIVEWLDMMFKDEPGQKLLLLDEFSGHWTGEVLAKCEEPQIHLMKIPAGCTSVSQPADVAWNRSFKAHLRKLWVARLMDPIAIRCPSRHRNGSRSAAG
jgi:hypothetical protein